MHYLLALTAGDVAQFYKGWKDPELVSICLSIAMLSVIGITIGILVYVYEELVHRNAARNGSKLSGRVDPAGLSQHGSGVSATVGRGQDQYLWTRKDIERDLNDEQARWLNFEKVGEDYRVSHGGIPIRPSRFRGRKW